MSANNKPLTLEHCQETAAIMGGKCMSTKYVNANVNLTWQCEYGHRWDAPAGRVRAGHWCPYCGNNKKHTIENARSIAVDRGGECLSEVYINNKSKMRWRCASGHEWMATLEKVGARKQWCSVCGSSSVQRRLFDIIVGVFPGMAVLYNYKGFPWLRTSKRSVLEVDIFVRDPESDFSLAIEYDGKQHQEPVARFGGEKEFVEVRRRDKLKNRRIKAHKGDVKHFIRFSYKESITKDYVIRKLMNSGVLL